MEFDAEVALDRIEWRGAVKIALAAALGWTVGIWSSHMLDRPDSLVSGLWCTLAAIVVLQNNIGGTYKAASERVFGIIVGSALGAIFSILFTSNPISLGLSVLCTIVICSLLKLKEGIRIACLSVTVVMVGQGVRSEISPWLFAFYRSLDSFLGICVAMGIAHLIWPSQATQKLYRNFLIMLDKMHILYRKVVQIDAIYDSKEFIGLCSEINELILQNQNMLKEAKIELLTRPERLDAWIGLEERVEHIFLVILEIKQVFDSPRKLVDPLLETQMSQTLNQIDNSFKELFIFESKDQNDLAIRKLLETQENLNDDLTRFRETRAIRRFSLIEVESFFVFFYSLHSLMKELRKTSAELYEIKTLEGFEN